MRRVQRKTELISARSTFRALKDLSKTIGTQSPNRLGSVYVYVELTATLGLIAFLFWTIATDGTMEDGFPLFNKLSVVLLMTALTASVWETLRHVPKLRNIFHFRHGLVRGFDWGPTAAICDETGVDIWREGEHLHLDWSMVRAVHKEDQLTVIETTDEQLHVVPNMPSARSMLASYRTSRGMGPWNDIRSVASQTPDGEKRGFSGLIGIAVWIAIFLTVIGVTLLLEAKPATADLLRDANLPEWYEDVSAEDRNAALNAEQSVNLPIHDRKIRVEEESYHVVSQSFFAVHDRSMLERFGDIQLVVDPNFERATMHRLRIHRDGEVLDQLSLPFEELRREPELNAGVMNGDVEYFGQIADLRVGDTIELIWSKKSTTPVFPRHFNYRADKPRPWGWEQRRTTIDLPATTDFALKHTDDFKVRRSNSNDRTILEWSLEKIEDDAGNARAADDWDISNDGLQLSTFRDWAQVAQGFADDYKARPDLLPEELVSLLGDIAEQSEDPEWRATQALRLVQDRVRYFSVSIGESGWIPRNPADVWLSAYGDCKDKALLLISMLARLDVEADVVIVDHDMGPALPRMLPSPFIFDHAIVRIRDPQGDWFVDPTDLLQGGMGRNIPLKDFAWGLPLATGSSELVEIVRHMPKEPTEEVLQEYTFLDEGPVAAILDVTKTWRGVEADYMRWRYDGDDREDRRARYAKWYAKRFPGAEHSEDLIVQDDLDANVLKLVQRYTLPRKGFEEKGLWTKLDHYGYAISGELYEFDDDEVLEGHSRVNTYKNVEHKVIMNNVPAPLTKPKPLHFENDFIKFETAGEWDDAASKWSYEWKLRTKETTLRPGDEDAWREAEDFVDNNDHYKVYLHHRLFDAVAGQPRYMGLNMSQLMFFPVFLAVSLFVALMFRRGARAEVSAAKAKIDEGNK
jgi:hypothetical protein